MRGRCFLFLQGPHGPFFSQLAGVLKSAGASVHRIGFNAGDAAFWRHRGCYTPFLGEKADWGAFLEGFLDDQGITDLVLYGDTREIHATARRIARRRGLNVHCFEEGYLRPYWVTYERDGVNGNSQLMHMTVAQMRQKLGEVTGDVPGAPAVWGSLWHHIFYGAAYHGFVMLMNRRYRNFKPHRKITVRREFELYCKRLVSQPWRGLASRLTWKRLRDSGINFHLVLLQLAHDSSFRDHSDFSRVEDFIESVCAGFARGAPRHHHLVFKTHPLEDGREPLIRLIRRSAMRHGVERRVRILHGGKLGEMLDKVRSAITVNSTAGQQVLWRGLPLKAFGRSVYSHAEFVSYQPIAEFFAHPHMPDKSAYKVYRQFLLETSQFPGGFYTREGRAQVLRTVVDVLLENRDLYATPGIRTTATAAPRPQLAVDNPRPVDLPYPQARAIG